MQSGLQFFEMPLKGLGTCDTQKIGIKMPGHNPEKFATDDGDFSEIMDALMALTPEQLQASLDKMEWVPVEGTNGLYAPVIDIEIGAQELSQILPKEVDLPTPLRPIDLSVETPSRDSGRTTEVLNPFQVAIGGGENSNETPPQIHPKEVTLFSTEPSTFNAKTEFTPNAKAEFTPNAKAEFTPNAKAEFTPNADLEVTPMPAPKLKEGGAPIVPHKADMGLGDSTKVFESEKTSEALKHTEMTTVPRTEKSVGVIKGVEQGKSHEPAIEAHSPLPEHKAEVREKSTQRAQPDFQNKLDSMDDQPKSEVLTRASTGDSKLNPAVAAKQFQVAPETSPNTSDKMINAAHQIKETPLKEAGRQSLQSAPAQEFLDQAAEKTNKVQPTSSAKDAALSFTSRWSPMAENNPESITESKSTTGGSGRVDSSDVIRQIVQRMSLKTRGFQSQMNIKLKPEFLGNVRMQITTDQQHVAVRMMAESSAVKEVLEQNIQYLKAELQQHGLEIDKFDVFVGKESDEHRHGQQHANWQRRAPHKEPPFEGEESGNSRSKEDDIDNKQARYASSATESEIDYFA